MNYSLLKKTTLSLLFFTIVSTTGCDLFKDKAIKQVETFINKQAIDKTAEDWKTTLKMPPQVEFSENKQYLWQLTTNKGEITIELMPDVAPMHVSSTMYLTKLGVYDDTIFHRVISGFMAQGGDPLGTGRGNPGYKYAGEFSEDIKHTEAGMLSMANAGPNTDGSQFFITFAPTPWLDGKHTIFGKVIEGMKVVETIEGLGSRSGKTKEGLQLLSAKILVK